MSAQHTPDVGTDAVVVELIDLLKRAQRLGLDFEVGTAYIRRSYIDEQTELNRLINAAIAKATGRQA